MSFIYIYIYIYMIYENSQILAHRQMQARNKIALAPLGEARVCRRTSFISGNCHRQILRV